jgi:hypothetical protein
MKCLALIHDGQIFFNLVPGLEGSSLQFASTSGTASRHCVQKSCRRTCRRDTSGNQRQYYKLDFLSLSTGTITLVIADIGRNASF